MVMKVGGQLYEDPTKGLQERLQKISQNPAIVAPSLQPANQGLGGTFMERVMATSGARVEKAQKEAMAKEQTLQGAQRLTQPGQPGVKIDYAAEIKRLEDIGHLNREVEAAVQARLRPAQEQLTPVKAEVKTSSLAAALGIQDPVLAASNPKFKEAKSAILAFADAADDPAAYEQALVKLTNLGIGKDQITSLLDTTASAMGKQLAQQIPDQLTVNDLISQATGVSIESVASTLGLAPADVSKMNLQQFQEAIENRKQAEYSRVANLRAEYAAAPLGSNQRELLKRELQSYNMAGITGIESKMAQTVDDLDLSQPVKIGDKLYDVENLLSDQGISDLVNDYLAADTPTEKEALLPAAKYGELRAWVDSNSAALSQLSETMGENTKQWTATQEQWLNLPTQMGVDETTLKTLMPAYDSKKPVTTAQLNEILTKASVQPLVQALRGGGHQLKSLIANASPADIQMLNDRPAQDIINAGQQYMLYQNNKDVVEFLGQKSDMNFMDFVKNGTVTGLGDYVKAFQALRAQGQSGIFNDPTVGAALRKLTPVELEDLAYNPNRLVELRSLKETRIGAEAGTLDKVAWGPAAMGQAAIVENLKLVKKAADLGDNRAKSLWEPWKAVLGDNPANLEKYLKDTYAQDIKDEDILAGRARFVKPKAIDSILATQQFVPTGVVGEMISSGASDLPAVAEGDVDLNTASFDSIKKMVGTSREGELQRFAQNNKSFKSYYDRAVKEYLKEQQSNVLSQIKTSVDYDEAFGGAALELGKMGQAWTDMNNFFSTSGNADEMRQNLAPLSKMQAQAEQMSQAIRSSIVSTDKRLSEEMARLSNQYKLAAERIRDKLIPAANAGIARALLAEQTAADAAATARAKANYSAPKKSETDKLLENLTTKPVEYAVDPGKALKDTRAELSRAAKKIKIKL